MRSFSHSACVMIALCSFYSAVFCRALFPGGAPIVYIIIGTLLFIVCVLVASGFQLKRTRNKKLR